MALNITNMFTTVPALGTRNPVIASHIGGENAKYRFQKTLLNENFA
jgi:hypothetical protein